MSSSIIISYLKHQIHELEARVKKLTDENKALKLELEQSKSLLLIKSAQESDMREKIEGYMKSKNDDFEEVRVMREKLAKELQEIAEIKQEIISNMQYFVDHIK